MRTFMRTGLVALMAMGICSCESDDDAEIDPANLPGIWVNTHKDGEEVPTDDRFVTAYGSDNRELYAIRGAANHWTENSQYTYAYDAGFIAIEGNGTQLQYEIRELSRTKLVYRVSRLVIGGVDLEDASTYELRKVEVDLSDEIVGLWEGHETTDGVQGATHRWRYEADGTYDYFHAQANGAWRNKADNAGEYFLYGDHFVSNYRNDANSGVAGNACEGWTIEIQGDEMSWTALRNGKTYSFVMTRVAE